LELQRKHDLDSLDQLSLAFWRSRVDYVKHLAKSIPNQVLAFMKSYFPKVPVDVVAGGLAANCTDEQYAELLEQMAPIAEQVAEKLNLQ
jgi:hypothetical protein